MAMRSCFWDITLVSSVKSQADTSEEYITSETSVHFQRTTRVTSQKTKLFTLIYVPYKLGKKGRSVGILIKVYEPKDLGSMPATGKDFHLIPDPDRLWSQPILQ
jgi:hypothetical protein